MGIPKERIVATTLLIPNKMVCATHDLSVDLSIKQRDFMTDIAQNIQNSV